MPWLDWSEREWCKAPRSGNVCGASKDSFQQADEFHGTDGRAQFTGAIEDFILHRYRGRIGSRRTPGVASRKPVDPAGTLAGRRRRAICLGNLLFVGRGVSQTEACAAGTRLVVFHPGK